MQNSNNKQKIYPVYLFRGKQDLLIERETENIRNMHIREVNDFNYFVFDAENTSASEIIDSSNTTSMFDNKKMIVVKNCDKLKPGDIKELASYAHSPFPGTCLVMQSGDKKKPAFKKNSNLLVRTFEESDNIEDLIIDESKKFDINLTKRAVSIMHDLLGDDLRTINNEILKLSQYYHDKKRIEPQDIRNFISNRKHESVFELTNAVSERNAKKAVSVLSELESQGHDPISIISTLSWRFKQINQAKQYINEKLSKEEIIKKIGTSKGAFYFLSRHSGNFDFDELRRIYRSIRETDLKLKSTGTEPYGLLSGLILDICSKK